jgi:hypothetical protein
VRQIVLQAPIAHTPPEVPDNRRSSGRVRFQRTNTSLFSEDSLTSLFTRRFIVMTTFTRNRLIGFLSAAAGAAALAQTASAITLPKPPPPPAFQIACYYSFHLVDSFAFAPYAEVVFAASAGVRSCSDLNATLGVSNIVGIAIGTGTTSPAALPNYGPFTLAGLAAAAAQDGLPESANVGVVNGVATLISLDLYVQNPATYQYVQLQSQEQSWVDLEFFQFDLQLTVGAMVPKSSWSVLLPATSPIPLLTNPPSGEFSQ